MSVPEHLRFPVGCHPVDQVPLWCSERPADAQLDVIRAFAACRYVLATFPNSGGKTSVCLPICILSIMCAFRGAIVVIEGGSEKQLFAQLFNTNLFPLIENLPDWKVWKGDRPRIRAPNGSECEGYVASDELKVEGFHGKWETDRETRQRYYRPMVYITDESKGISNDKKNGILRIEPDFWLAVTSPGTDGNHWTYEDMKPAELEIAVKERKAKAVERDIATRMYEPDPVYCFPGEFWRYRRMIKPDDLPHLQTKDRLEYRENLKKQYGENSQWYRSMAKGEFALDASENNIFMADHVQRALWSMQGNARPLPGDIRSAADVSGGKDAQVFGVREGTDVVLLKKLDPMNEPETARKLVELNTALGIEPYQFWIDGGGNGAAIGNIMETTLGFAGINRCMANVSPTLSFEYADKYAEIHYWIKELLTYGVLSLPFSQDLLDQMRDRLYSVRTGAKQAGRIACEPKDRYRESHSGRSPDDLDTLVYLFYDFNMDAVRRGLVSTTERKVSDLAKPFDPLGRFRGGKPESGIFAGMPKVPALDTLIPRIG